jgi:hypothetical protein
MRFYNFKDASEYAKRIAKELACPTALKKSGDYWEILINGSPINENENEKKNILKTLTNNESKNNCASKEILNKPNFKASLIAKHNNKFGHNSETTLCFVCKNSEFKINSEYGVHTLFCNEKSQSIELSPRECNEFLDARSQKNHEILQNLYGEKSYAINKSKRK